MTELQLLIAGVLAAFLAALLIAGLIGAAIARAKSAGIVDILIQEHPKRHWHYRASIKGHEVIPRRKGGHTSSGLARRAAERILRVGSVKVMNFSEVQRERALKSRKSRAKARRT